MKKNIIIIVLFFNLISNLIYCQSGQNDRNLKIKVSKEWINSLRNYDYNKDNTLILEQFESFIFPDTLAGSNEYSHEGGGLLTPMFVNLDNDANDELIGLFGWNEVEPTLAVFKLIGEDWFLLYLEPFYMFYDSPEIKVVNNISTNKTFYIRWLYERGSGIYCDAYHFYKLIDNKVYSCLTLINSAYIFGWGIYLNQIVEMSFNFKSKNDDILYVTYKYNFFPGAVYKNDMPWEGHEDIPFVKGEKKLKYYWDSLSLSYKPVFNTRNKDDLTEQKILCFGSFGNDTLFVKAYDFEIKQTLKKGTSEQKKLLQDYLDIVKTNQHANSPTGEMEEVWN